MTIIVNTYNESKINILKIVLEIDCRAYNLHYIYATKSLSLLQKNNIK